MMRMLAVVVVLATLCSRPAAMADGRLLLPEQPADSLAGRLEAAAAHGSVAKDLAVEQHRRKLDGGGVLVETTVRNRGDQAAAVPGVTVADWSVRLRDQRDEGYRKLAYRNDTWYGSTYWTGPDWTRVGKDWHHPGENTPAVRRFTCPRDGRVTISGRVYKAHVKPSDGVRLAIRHGKETVWTAEIDGTDAEGVEPKLTLDVRAGDAIRFVVHKRRRIFCDTTHWDPVVEYADGPTFQASNSFSTTEQGVGGWSYEMEADGQTGLGLPRLYALGRDLAIREIALAADQSVAIGPRDALPVLVIADDADSGGVVAALDGGEPWQIRAVLEGDRRLNIIIKTDVAKSNTTLEPGQTLAAPPLAVSPYRGAWTAGMLKLAALFRGEESAAKLANLRTAMTAAVDAAGVAELELWLMVQAEWRREDNLDGTPAGYRAAIERHVEKTRLLLDDLRCRGGNDFLTAEAAEFARLADAAKAENWTPAEAADLYQRVRGLKRRIALANPLVQFGPMLFCKRVPTSYSHLVMQYYGWRARPGGGIFVLDEPGRSLGCRDVLAGRLAGGCVLEPRLSYDGRKIVFSYVDLKGKTFEPGEVLNDRDEGFYHVWTVNTDGSELRQVTAGPYDDLMPTWLPDGGIAFCSTRRQGYARCFGGQFSRRWHVYTLHRVETDGNGLRTLSFHDTNEWFPTVSHTGHILYARWDYIDRDAVTHQNLWSTRPDGTNPVALWGNATLSPHCTFQLQPIPGTSKVVFTASAHHSIAGGSIAVVDPTVADNGQAAIRRVTPEVPFPEAEGRNIPEYYTAPWPLSEDYFLVGYSPTPLVWEPGANGPAALGIYLLDAWGNRELIYRDPQIGSTNPCPLRPRPTPPVLASTLPERAEPTGEMILADVYRGLGDVPRGSIKQIRVVQIFPKTTNVANSPPIGMAREENGRAILGTVPVAEDGSARFLVPARRPILFQALDAEGRAYQTMRTITYVQPGEKIACVGCHENRRTTPYPEDGEVAALGRPAARIEPGPLGGRPFSYVEVVQPVLDRRCVECHRPGKAEGGFDLSGAPEGSFTRSYVALCGDVDFWANGTNADNAAKAMVPRFGGRNRVEVTPPGGMYGARGSRLMKLLDEGHENVKLTDDELRRLAAWIDLNAIFYGVNLPEDQARQLRGEAVSMPAVQ